MKTIENHDVKIFTDLVEDSAVEQIKELLSIGVFSGCKIRVMPDVHAGAGCVIGFTGDLGERVIPNVVGVDIGCGISVQPFKCLKPIDFHALNEFILGAIPCGRNIRDAKFGVLPNKYMDSYREGKSIVRRLLCYRELKADRLDKAMGTLGGGNHFIEVDTDESGRHYLLVHTGSRNLGKQVAELYQKLAVKNMCGWDDIMHEQRRIIDEYKRTGRRTEIQEAIRQLHNSFKMSHPPIPAEVCYLEGQAREDYLFDMRLCQRWAVLNRRLIIDMIMDFLVREGYAEVTDGEWFESVHNYIGDDNIIRKGAISAREGQKCIIPLNMRDGALICVGKGNEDWNFSAPHGAGRVMSRTQAFNTIRLEDFRQSMSGIYSETVTEETIDESPMAYKPKDQIIGNIADTVSILTTIHPVFNFKAAE